MTETYVTAPLGVRSKLALTKPTPNPAIVVAYQVNIITRV